MVYTYGDLVENTSTTLATGENGFLYCLFVRLFFGGWSPAGWAWGGNIDSSYAVHAEAMRAINDSGQMVIIGDVNGEEQTFFAYFVPEPGTILMILGGLAGFAGIVYRRR